MKQTTLKIAGLALATVMAVFTVRADVTLNQNISTYGYAAGSLSYTNGTGSNSDTRFDLDAAKIGFAFNFSPVTAKMSIYTDSGAKDLYLLEANVSYDLGNGLSVTGGRFISWVGYEPFDIPNGNFVTGGNIIANLMPNFHEGVRLDYQVDKNTTVGVALVDSIYNGNNKYSGDGSLSNGYGIEGHLGYNDGAFSASAVLTYQNSHGNGGTVDQIPFTSNYWGGSINAYYNNVFAIDLWAQYIVKKTTFAAEVYAQRLTSYTGDNLGLDLGNQTNFYGLVMVKQQISDKASIAGRVTLGNQTSEFAYDGSFWKISFTPAYVLTKNLSVAGEVNYTHFSEGFKENHGYGRSGTAFVGVQACFKF